MALGPTCKHMLQYALLPQPVCGVTPSPCPSPHVHTPAEALSATGIPFCLMVHMKHCMCVHAHTPCVETKSFLLYITHAILYGWKFILADWQFWEQSTKTLQCAVIIIRNHSFHVYTRPAAGCASVVVSMEFTIHSCVRGYHVSKGFWTLEVGEELAC